MDPSAEFFILLTLQNVVSDHVNFQLHNTVWFTEQVFSSLWYLLVLKDKITTTYFPVIGHLCDRDKDW